MTTRRESPFHSTEPVWLMWSKSSAYIIKTGSCSAEEWDPVIRAAWDYGYTLPSDDPDLIMDALVDGRYVRAEFYVLTSVSQ